MKYLFSAFLVQYKSFIHTKSKVIAAVKLTTIKNHFFVSPLPWSQVSLGGVASSVSVNARYSKNISHNNILSFPIQNKGEKKKEK